MTQVDNEVSGHVQTQTPRENWLDRVAKAYGNLVRAIDSPVIGDAAAAEEEKSIMALAHGDIITATKTKLKAFDKAITYTGKIFRHRNDISDRSP